MSDDDIDFDFVDASPVAVAQTGFALRDYQIASLNAVDLAWSEGVSRTIIVVAGGLGKTVIAANIAKREVERGGRVLFLAHSEELLSQAIDKFHCSVGLEAEMEKADEHASTFAPVVVASIQTMVRTNRLTGFSDDHFSLVIVDECHRSMGASYQKVMNYFHFGAQSLVEGWEMPAMGLPFEHKARILGVTATASRGDKKSLGDYFQKVAYEYGLLEAVRDGYLVRPIVKNIPLQIDVRGIKVSRSGGQGSDLDIGEVANRIAPILRQIAKQIAIHARNLKTVVFTPSVETARLLTEALCNEGMNGIFVSGACTDRDEKVQDFRDAGPGSVLCNAILVVEGFDVPDIDCVCVLRPTKIWSFYCQACLRGTRTLTGTLDGLTTKEERLAAIARSGKTHFTILDFLWLSDRIDLIQPVDLVTTKPDIRKQMLANPGTDLVAIEAVAERDVLKALEKAAKKHQRKQGRVLDPLAWAVSLGDAALASYEPQSKWEFEPPTPGQLNFIRGQGLDTGMINTKGLASKVMQKLTFRLRMHLATPRQLSLMAQLGLDEKTCTLLTMKEATEVINKTLANKGERRAVSSEHQPALL